MYDHNHRRSLLSSALTVTALALAAFGASPRTSWAQAPSPQLVNRAAAAGLDLPSTPSWDVATVDYDKDGDMDFSVSLHMKNAGQLRRNNGDGTFTRVAFSSDPARTIMPRPNELGGLVDRHACAWADFDRNGLPDSYCTAGRYLENHYKAEAINNELWRQTSVGVFVDSATASGVGEPCTRGRHPAVLDVNNDGWPDLFTGAQLERADADDRCNDDPNYPYIEQSKVFINLGRTAGGSWRGFRNGTEWQVSQSNSGARLALPWDYNRDGRMDLLAGTFPGKPAFLYRNTGTGFKEVARSGVVNLPTFNGATVADVTGEGIPDLVFADDLGFAYRAGTSTGVSTTTVRLGTLPSGAVGRSVAVGDVNGDRRMDVYGLVGSATSIGNPDDYIYVSTSTGGRQVHTVPPASGDANDVAAITISGRAQFLVLNGGNDESENPGPVQLIAWR